MPSGAQRKKSFVPTQSVGTISKYLCGENTHLK